MDDLIERLRALSRHEHSDYSIGDEAAAALEAAREDVERYRWLRALWRVARAKAGLPDVRLYDLRGKSGSDAADDAEAQARLGHTDSKVTRRHYRRKPSRAKPTR